MDFWDYKGIDFVLDKVLLVVALTGVVVVVAWGLSLFFNMDFVYSIIMVLLVFCVLWNYYENRNEVVKIG